MPEPCGEQPGGNDAVAGSARRPCVRVHPRRVCRGPRVECADPDPARIRAVCSDVVRRVKEAKAQEQVPAGGRYQRVGD